MAEGGPDPEQNQSLAQRVVSLLIARGLTLATCESVTGGLVGAEITSIAGSSAAFRGGFVTYASDLKSRWAGVDAELIAREGVINAATAESMASGVRQAAGADLGLACTGVAGPGAQDGAPAGTVWVALASDGMVTAQLLQLEGDRAQIRHQTVTHLLRMALDFLD